MIKIYKPDFSKYINYNEALKQKNMQQNKHEQDFTRTKTLTNITNGYLYVYSDSGRLLASYQDNVIYSFKNDVIYTIRVAIDKNTIMYHYNQNGDLTNLNVYCLYKNVLYQKYIEYFEPNIYIDNKSILPEAIRYYCNHHNDLLDPDADTSCCHHNVACCILYYNNGTVKSRSYKIQSYKENVIKEINMLSNNLSFDDLISLVNKPNSMDSLMELNLRCTDLLVNNKISKHEYNTVREEISCRKIIHIL